MRIDDPDLVRPSYVSAGIRRSHLADRTPEFDCPLVARSSQAVFVVEKAA